MGRDADRHHDKGYRRHPWLHRVAWLRRVYFDLIGLPPSPEEVAAFLRECASGEKDNGTIRQSDNRTIGQVGERVATKLENELMSPRSARL